MRARKSLGQNFLIDRNAVDRIVAAASIRQGDDVLEIGPGRGALTSPLIEAAGRLTAVEADGELAAMLVDRFGPDRLRLIHADVLKCDIFSGTDGPDWIVVGNLPYNISKPVADLLISGRNRLKRAVLMFQREVAERFVARPGSRQYGPQSVLAGLTFKIDSLFHLSPAAFRPSPKVQSTVTRWERILPDPLDAEAEAALRRTLRICFVQRRRTLRNNLRMHFDDSTRVEKALEVAALDGGRRAETLSAEEFLNLAALWQRASLV